LAAIQWTVKRPSDRTRYGWFSQGYLSCLWDRPVAFRPSLVFSAWPEARLIGGLLPGAMHSVLVTSCAATLVLWDTLRVVYKEKHVVFKVYT